MKKVFILALAAMGLFACNKDEIPNKTDQNSEAAATIRINVQGGAYTRAVEDGHDGANDDKVMPKVYSVTVIAYNDSRVVLSEVDLSFDEMKKAVYSSTASGVDVYDPQNSTSHTTVTSKGEGSKVGLPVGTKYVDVVLNRPAGTNAKGVTNINYFNYSQSVLTQGPTLGDQTTNAKDNFERVYLVSDQYGQGTALSSSNKKPNQAADEVPEYIIDFSVHPSFARLEITKGIQIVPSETWTDKWKRTWKKTSLKEFTETIIPSISGTDKDGVAYTCSYAGEKNPTDVTSPVVGNVVLYNGSFLIFKKTSQGDKWTTFQGAVYNKDDADYDPDTVFFPEGYWYDTGASSSPSGDYDKNTAIAKDDIIDEHGGSTPLAGWVKSAVFTSGTIVEWYPNGYYAVDIEAVYINNVKVRSAEYSAYYVPWPGNGDAAQNWPNWHKYYHDHGWHIAGSSTDNSFLCMGNMWDRIASSNTKVTTNIPDIDMVTGTGTGTKRDMELAGGKLIADGTTSQYWGTTANNGAGDNRNLGIITGKASAFQIYTQKIEKANPTQDDVASLMPHLILKVKAYKTATEYAKEGASYDTGKQYLTITRFKNTGSNGTGYVTEFKSAFIYRIDLSTLRSAFVGNAPVPGGKDLLPVGVTPKNPLDPDPEMPNSQLDMNVSVVPWTIANITPDI